MAGTFRLNVTMTSPGGTAIGAHLYLEIPDQSSGAAFTIGTNTIGDGSTTTGPWSVLDLGKYPFSAMQPWEVVGPAPFDYDDTKDQVCRLYAIAYSESYEAQLVRANQPGASPNQPFTLISLKSGSPTSGTNITTLTGDDGNYVSIVATVLSPVNVTGKLETPVLVDLSSTPPNTPGWVARLVLTVGNTNPMDQANQQVVSGVFSKAGPVYAPSGDGIAIPHSFALDTPKALTNATLWLQAGLSKSDGAFKWNNIVPGITPEWPITYGSTVGTTDATAMMTATIDASMAIVNSLFGVATAGITNPLLGSGAVATINIQALAVTNPLLASLCVQAAQLASSSVTATAIAALAVGTGAIQTAAITNALIANLAVSGAQIQSATITGANIANATIAGANIGTATIVQANMANASIGTAQIQSLAVTDAEIANLSAGKITTGILNAIATTGCTVLLNNNSITTTLDNSLFALYPYSVSIPVGLQVDNGTYSSYVGAGFMAISKDGTPPGGDTYLTHLFSVTSGGVGLITLFDGTGGIANSNAATLSPTGLSVGALPSTAPSSGSKAFWYDPSDSNRVKYVP